MAEEKNRKIKRIGSSLIIHFFLGVSCCFGTTMDIFDQKECRTFDFLSPKIQLDSNFIKSRFREFNVDAKDMVTLEYSKGYDSLLNMFLHLGIDKKQAYKKGYLTRVLKENKISSILLVGVFNAGPMVTLRKILGEEINLYICDLSFDDWQKKIFRSNNIIYIEKDVLKLQEEGLYKFDIIGSVGLLSSGASVFWQEKEKASEFIRDRLTETFSSDYCLKIAKAMVDLLSTNKHAICLISTQTEDEIILLAQEHLRSFSSILHWEFGVPWGNSEAYTDLIVLKKLRLVDNFLKIDENNNEKSVLKKTEAMIENSI